MDKPYIEIVYKLADGKRIRLEVTSEVKELLEQSDRQIRSQRRQDRRHHKEYIEGLTDTTMIFPNEDIADLLIRMDSYRRLYSAVEKLTETQQRRLRLYFIEGLTYCRIAELEGVNHKSVIESISQGLRKLRQNLSE